MKEPGSEPERDEGERRGAVSGQWHPEDVEGFGDL